MAIRALTTLTASVLRTTTVISTSIATLVEPGLLSGSPVKLILRVNTSEKLILNHNFASLMKFILKGKNQKKLLLHHNFAQIHTLPAGFPVQAKFIPDQSLHLVLVELLLFQLAITVEHAAARA